MALSLASARYSRASLGSSEHDRCSERLPQDNGVSEVLASEPASMAPVPRATPTTGMGKLFTSQRGYRPLISERMIDLIRCCVSRIGSLEVARRSLPLHRSRCAHDVAGMRPERSFHSDRCSSRRSYNPLFGRSGKESLPAYVRKMLPDTAGLRGGSVWKPRVGPSLDCKRRLGFEPPP